MHFRQYILSPSPSTFSILKESLYEKTEILTSSTLLSSKIFNQTWKDYKNLSHSLQFIPTKQSKSLLALAHWRAHVMLQFLTFIHGKLSILYNDAIHSHKISYMSSGTRRWQWSKNSHNTEHYILPFGVFADSLITWYTFARFQNWEHQHSRNIICKDKTMCDNLKISDRQKIIHHLSVWKPEQQWQVQRQWWHYETTVNI